MRSLFVLVACLLVAGLGWLVARTGAERPREEGSVSRSGVLMEGVVLSEHTQAGDVVVEIAEIARVPGRIGFIRSPLVPGVELRDVKVRRGGEVIDRRDRVDFSGRELRGMKDLDDFVSSWTRSLLPENGAPTTARARFEAMSGRGSTAKPTHAP